MAVSSSFYQGDLAREIALRARQASIPLAKAESAKKDRVLERVAMLLEDPSTGSRILEANKRDLDSARAAGLSNAMLDRLLLTPARLSQLARTCRQVLALADPVGSLEPLPAVPSGIEVARMRVPLGVILLIYEARPNVTVDAAALCLKSGNAVILRGGREAIYSNAALARVFHEALSAEGLPHEAVTLVENSKRELLYELLKQVGLIDVAIPRGGLQLIEAVATHARVPLLYHAQGVCHVYVHASANFDMGIRIAVNAKVQRPGVCNAMEGLLIDSAIAQEFVPRIAEALAQLGVEIHACPISFRILEQSDIPARYPEKVVQASESDYSTEFLDLRCVFKVVAGYDEALQFIERYGSKHTEAIITEDKKIGERFLREVDASCVLVNASPRLNDGGELGLGSEIGISTTKLHSFGPMGLEELCAKKFVVRGVGQLRGE